MIDVLKLIGWLFLFDVALLLFIKIMFIWIKRLHLMDVPPDEKEERK